VFFLVGQLIFGACVRHLQTMASDGVGLEIPYWAVMVHITVGVLVFAIATLLGFRSGSVYRSIPLLRGMGMALLIVVSLQLVLGIVALVAISARVVENPPIWEVIFTSMHQATGALLLGLSALFLVWHLRLVRPETKRDSDVVPVH
jgi:heme A synthase